MTIEEEKKLERISSLEEELRKVQLRMDEILETGMAESHLEYEMLRVKKQEIQRKLRVETDDHNEERKKRAEKFKENFPNM